MGPDLRGYGGSSKPPHIKDYALMKSVGDVAGIADALGSNRFAVVGHDWGAVVSLGKRPGAAGARGGRLRAQHPFHAGVSTYATSRRSCARSRGAEAT